MIRIEGYYWVKHQGNWEIAKWYEYVGGRFEWGFFDRTKVDGDFDEIDERRIEREYHDGPKQAAESIWLINKLFKK